MKTEINLIPDVKHIVQSDGFFKINNQTLIETAEDGKEIAHSFCDMLAPALGYMLAIQNDSTAGDKPIIQFTLVPSMQHLGNEGYTLSVTPQKIKAQAYAKAGLFYAAQTIRQLLPVEVFSSRAVEGVVWQVPCCVIEDQPRFSWRGAMLDVSRHFFPVEFIYKFIDLLAMHKMNSFHWHLTDDQGWRIEIKKYPRLTEVGAWRKETRSGHENNAATSTSPFDGIPHGGFYSQQEIRSIVAYAHKRYINVVPEIDMPGHAQAAIAAYPLLGNTGKTLEVGTTWGIYENVYNVNDSTIHFLQDVLDEVLDLFPSPFIHVGGDEVPKTQWKGSPEAQARMKEIGLKNEDELQSYFIRRMDQFLTSRGRRLIGWDEILEGGLAQNATVMSWRGEAGGIAAVQSGHNAVMAPNTHTYLDYYQTKEKAGETLAIGGYLPLEKVYLYEPVPAGISADKRKLILGAQAQLWSEYMPTPARVEYMAFPRLCAFSEVVWRTKGQCDYPAFLSRLNAHQYRLDQLKVNYHR